MAEPAPPASTSSAPGPAPRFWNVPNSLSLARLGLAVVVFILVGQEQWLAAAIVFGLAAITDALDGYLARLLDQETPIGRQLDPLVDKVIVAGTYIYLLTVPDTGVLPWMVTTIVIRELLIQGLRSHLEGGGHAFGAKAAGKVKTVFQCFSITAILLVLAWQPGPVWVWVRDGLTWIAVLMTLYSGLGYFLAASRSLQSPGSQAA